MDTISKVADPTPGKNIWTPNVTGLIYPFNEAPDLISHRKSNFQYALHSRNSVILMNFKNCE
jgi:hypothetical protein